MFPGWLPGRVWGGFAPAGSWSATDAAVAHGIENVAQQLAGGGDLGDVFRFPAAAGDDGVLDLAGAGTGGLPLDRLDHRPAQDPRALPRHVPARYLDIGLAAPRRQARPGGQLPGPGKRRMSPVSATITAASIGPMPGSSRIAW